MHCVSHAQRGSFPLPRAFTLIELLVVIAIIALLVGILLPALAAARRTARTVKCLAQLHNIEIAHTLYMQDHHEFLVDAGLAHGGIGSPQHSWPVLLAGYNNGPLALRSPADNSLLWPVTEGGTYPGPSLSTYLELTADNDPSNDPAPGTLARWSSYGLNNYTTFSHGPPPELSAHAPFDRLGKIPRPYATVHFLIMTFDGSFARSDHIHADEWPNSPRPENHAADQCQTNAHGGKARSFSALSNYTFLDGHAATLRFEDVYTNINKNKFDPEIAQ